MLIDIARHHALEKRLEDVTLTPDELREYCWLEAHRSGAISNGLVLPDLNWYVTDAMLLQYWTAVDWWPKDLPAHPCPTLRELVMQAPHLRDHTALTLGQLLADRGAKVARALVELKRSVVNPNESPAERKARLNRERVSRSRGRKSSDSVPVPREPAVAAVAAPLSPVAVQVAELKAAAKLELEQVDQWCREAHREMLRRSEVRRGVRAAWDAKIEALTNGDGGCVPPVPV